MKTGTVQASDVRKQWSDVLIRVAFGGEKIIVTRSGRPMVEIIPAKPVKRTKRSAI